jgi:thimet oligopeptidase
LKGFATNPKGEPIPKTLVDRMNAARFFGEAIGTRGQLSSSAVSLNYYNRPPGFDLKQMYDAQVTKYGMFPPIPEAHPYAGFGHLNGYSAIYYTYVWSKAIAVDLLTRFKADGLRNPAVAQRYRSLVLAPGGSKDANVLIRDFLGRPLSLDAYKDYLSKEPSSGSGQ